jgi:hypothetical protein
VGTHGIADRCQASISVAISNPVSSGGSAKPPAIPGSMRGIRVTPRRVAYFWLEAVGWPSRPAVSLTRGTRLFVYWQHATFTAA